MKIKYRTATVTLTDGDYAGASLTIRKNVPMGVLVDLQELEAKPSALTKLWPSLAELSVSSNLETEDGTPIDVTTADGWARHVPPDLVLALLKAVAAELKDPFGTAQTQSSRPLSTAAD